MTLTVTSQPDHVQVTGHGLFTHAQAVIHFAELAVALEQVRRRGEPVRVVVDLRDSKPQTPDVADYIRARTAELYADSDRVAILVGSALLKLQLKRILDRETFGVFMTEEAGRDFLARAA